MGRRGWKSASDCGSDMGCRHVLSLAVPESVPTPGGADLRTRIGGVRELDVMAVSGLNKGNLASCEGEIRASTYDDALVRAGI